MKDYRSYISSFIRIADPIIKKRVDVELDLPADPIALRHGFHPVDYLPENDRIRFTIHPEARKEVLRRLLLLNHARYAE